MDRASPRPLVSVLIPAYNHEPYVTRALDSVLADGWKPVEIVLVDDASSDGTIARVERWREAHPEVDLRVTRHETNAGIGTRANELLALARGQYVAPLASDDELLPGGIAKRIRAMEGARAVFGDAEVIDGEGRLLHRSFLDSVGSNRSRLLSDVAAEIIFNWAVPGPVFLAETEALRELGGWAEDLIVEDWDLYLRLAARKWVSYLDTPVARYRIHGEGASWRPANSGRMVADQRRAAKRNRHRFTGAHRALLVFQELVYTPPWRAPARLVSKTARLVDRWLSVSPSRPLTNADIDDVRYGGGR